MTRSPICPRLIVDFVPDVLPHPLRVLAPHRERMPVAPPRIQCLQPTALLQCGAAVLAIAALDAESASAYTQCRYLMTSNPVFARRDLFIRFRRLVAHKARPGVLE